MFNVHTVKQIVNFCSILNRLQFRRSNSDSSGRRRSLRRREISPFIRRRSVSVNVDSDEQLIGETCDSDEGSGLAGELLKLMTCWWTKRQTEHTTGCRLCKRVWPRRRLNTNHSIHGRCLSVDLGQLQQPPHGVGARCLVTGLPGQR